ncbi:putative ABC transporter ATP-binding protein [Actinosynnema sp. ALI-1.44]
MNTLPIADRRTVAREITALLTTHKTRLARLLGVHLLAVAVGLVPPVLLGVLVDGVTTGFEGTEVDVVALLIGVALLAQSGLAFVATRLSFTLGEVVFADLREDFTERVLALPLSTVERVGPGEVLSRSTTDLESIRDIVRTGLPETIVGVLTAVLTVGAAFLVNPLVAGACVVGLPLIALSTRWFTRRAPAAFADELAAQAALTTAVAETARGAATVEALGLGDRRRQLVAERVARAEEASKRPVRLQVRWFPVVQAGYHLALVVVLAWGAWLVVRGRAGIGEVATIALFVRAMITPLDDLAYWFGEVQSASAAFARIFGVAPAPGTEEGPLPADAGLEIANLHFGYRPDRPVLHGIDLTVAPGERVAVVGPSGAGKSTLAMLVAGVLRPDAGRVAVGGVPVTDLAAPRDHVALVTQEDHVFHGTVADNLRLARPDAPDADLTAALGAVGAHLALDTELGPDAYQPTPAQSRQLALARVVLKDAPVVVLDEALTDGVDVLPPGRTVVQIVHRLDTAARADRVVVLADGRVVEHGPHDALLAAGGGYADMWAAWSGRPVVGAAE